tara:strand:- start:30 stop:380 length:351 start_codon:yes stop_codon:yes gene_type:complete
MNIKIENENITAVFSPLAGASLRSLSVRKNKEKYDIISNFEDELSPNKLPLGSGSFIMAPWVNRIKSGILETDKGFTQLPKDTFLRIMLMQFMGLYLIKTGLLIFMKKINFNVLLI